MSGVTAPASKPASPQQSALSRLPAPILISVLSYLPTVASARLSTVSRALDVAMNSPSVGPRVWSNVHSGYLTTAEWVPVLRKRGPYIRVFHFDRILLPPQPAANAPAAAGDSKSADVPIATAAAATAQAAIAAPVAGRYASALRLVTSHCPNLNGLTLGAVRDFSDDDMTQFWEAAAAAAAAAAQRDKPSNATAAAPTATPTLVRSPSIPSTTATTFHTFSTIHASDHFSARPFNPYHTSTQRSSSSTATEYSYTNPRLTGAGLRTLLTNCYRSLTNLTLVGCVGLEDKDLLLLLPGEAAAADAKSDVASWHGVCDTLQVLDLGYCDLKGSALSPILQGCTKLHTLGLGMTKIRDVSVEKKLPLQIGQFMGARATAINLAGWNIGVHVLGYMASQCVNLQTLIVSECNFETDAKLPASFTAAGTAAGDTKVPPARAVRAVPAVRAVRAVRAARANDVEYEDGNAGDEFEDAAGEGESGSESGADSDEDTAGSHKALHVLMQHCKKLRVLDLYGVQIADNAIVSIMSSHAARTTLQRVRFGPSIWAVVNGSIHDLLGITTVSRAGTPNPPLQSLTLVRDAIRKELANAARAEVEPSRRFWSEAALASFRARSIDAILDRSTGFDGSDRASEALWLLKSIGLHAEDDAAHRITYAPAAADSKSKADAGSATAKAADTKVDQLTAAADAKPQLASWVDCSITGTVGPALIRVLSRTIAPALESINVSSASIVNPGLDRALVSFVERSKCALRSLTLSFCQHITDETVVRLLELNRDSLTCLDVDELPQLSDAVLVVLANPKNPFVDTLRVLHVSGRRMTDAGLRLAWEACRALTDLGCSRMPQLTDAAFCDGKAVSAGASAADSKSNAAAAPPLRLRLQHLTLWGCEAITLATFQFMVAHSPHLSTIDVHGSSGVSRDGLLSLVVRHCTQLSTLDLSGLTLDHPNGLTHTGLWSAVKSVGPGVASCLQTLRDLDVSCVPQFASKQPVASGGTAADAKTAVSFQWPNPKSIFGAAVPRTRLHLDAKIRLEGVVLPGEEVAADAKAADLEAGYSSDRELTAALQNTQSATNTNLQQRAYTIKFFEHKRSQFIMAVLIRSCPALWYYGHVQLSEETENVDFEDGVANQIIH